MKRALTAISVALLLVSGILIPVAASAARKEARGVAVPRFVEEKGTGIDHRYDGEFEFFVGGGVAVFDCDGDRRPDIYIAGGSEPATLYRNSSDVGGTLAFEKVGAATTDLDLVTGAYPIDVDSDDRVDLVVLRRGENVLLRGMGDCTFTRANETWGVDGGSDWTVAFSAKWEPGASLPTLAFGSYLTIVDPGEQPVCAESSLVRPAADGSGYAPGTTLAPGYCTLSMLFSDWDRSGRMDLRVTNDRHYYIDGEEQLWRIEPGQEPSLWTHEEGWQQLRIWGMGIASQDLGGDGYPELYLTSMGDNKLQMLSDGPERPSYENIGLERGATAHRPFAGDKDLQSTGWHAEFDDVNNDGRMDLFVAKGNVEAMAEHAIEDPNNLLLGKPDGTFKEAAGDAGIVDFLRSRGAALADLNVDGLLDLVVVERREPLRMWRNLGSGSKKAAASMGNWLSVELAQDGANRDAIGSWIEVKAAGKTTAREVVVGGGHGGGQLGPTHFGLGSAGKAKLRVTWPDGETGEWFAVQANKPLLVERAADEPEILD